MGAKTDIIVGKYTSDGTYKILQLPIDVDHFEIHNYTQYSSTAIPGVVKRAWWFRNMPDNYYLGVKNTDGAATDESVLGTSGGFKELISTPNNYEAAGTVTAITNASPPVVSQTTHGYSVGDTVLLTATTGMLQVGGYQFTVTATPTADTYQIGYLDASGFAAAATAGVARRLATPPMFFPRKRFITAITQAASAVVTLSVTHGYSVGETITFNVPTAFGMTEINGLTGEITAVDTTNNTVTVDINSTAFTAFAFPVSATVSSPAEVIPVGDTLNTPTGATDNVGYRAIRIGETVDGALNDEMKWVARRGADFIEE